MDFYEQIVCEKLTRLGWDVSLPFKDKGVDVVAIKATNPGQSFVRIQVKGSKAYLHPLTGHQNCALCAWRPQGHTWLMNGWTRLTRTKLQKDLREVDFYVLVMPTFVGNCSISECPSHEVTSELVRAQRGHKNKSWDWLYLVLTPEELIERANEYGAMGKGSKGDGDVWDIYPGLLGDKIIDGRPGRDAPDFSQLRDWTRFRNAFDRLERKRTGLKAA